MNVQLFEFIKAVLTTTPGQRPPLGPAMVDIVRPASWISSNMATLLTLAGTTFAGICSAASVYFGNKNHNLTTQIHVDTDGRLSALTAEVAGLKAHIVTADAVAAATKVETDKAAAIAATAVVVAATVAPSDDGPHANVDSVITGTVDKTGVLEAEAHGVVKAP